jgi:hypothetical protein
MGGGLPDALHHCERERSNPAEKGPKAQKAMPPRIKMFEVGGDIMRRVRLTKQAFRIWIASLTLAMTETVLFPAPHATP